MDEKVGRAIKANALIDVIASCGRNFFSGGPRGQMDVSCFSVDQRGRIWFTDAYSGTRIYLGYKHWSKGFSHGGTLRDLVNALRDFIRTGEPLEAWRFDHDKNYWGYGDDMAIVAAKALELGIIEKAANGESER